MRLLHLLCAAGFLSAIAAHASPITYTETATASGTINGQAFTNALITFSGTGDTKNVSIYNAPSVYIGVSITLTVAGLGSTALNSNDVFYSGEDGFAGVIAPRDGSFLLGLFNPTLSSYDLRSALSSTTGLVDINSGFTGENFRLTGASNVTFQAVAATTTPEPSSLALLGTGVLGMIGVARKRFA